MNEPVRLPEVRYPLFWIAGLIALGVVGSVVWPLTRAWRDAWNERWLQAVQGPPVPSSPLPQTWEGPLLRRGLLLRENVPAADRPGGDPVETIGRRVFVAIYDVWPLSGPPTAYRVGNRRRAFGWVPEDALLPWDTRLVVRDPTDALARPILKWDGDRVLVAVWSPAEPWSRVESREWQSLANAGRAGVLVSRPELLALLRRLLADEPAEEIRIRALLGQLAESGPLPAGEQEAARRVLPEWARSPRNSPRGELVVRLSRRNEQWAPETSWLELEFLSIAFEDLP